MFKVDRIPVLMKLKNIIHVVGIFLHTAKKATIVHISKRDPPPKKNNNSTTTEEISPSSHVAKHFTAASNNRFMKYTSKNDIISDSQYGFKPFSV